MGRRARTAFDLRRINRLRVGKHESQHADPQRRQEQRIAAGDLADHHQRGDRGFCRGGEKSRHADQHAGRRRRGRRGPMIAGRTVPAHRHRNRRSPSTAQTRRPIRRWRSSIRSSGSCPAQSPTAADGLACRRARAPIASCRSRSPARPAPLRAGRTRNTEPAPTTPVKNAPTAGR